VVEAVEAAVLAGFALDLDQGFHVLRILDLPAAIEAALVHGDDPVALRDAHLFFGGEHDEHSLDALRGHGVVVEIEAHVGRTSGGDLRPLRAGRNLLMTNAQFVAKLAERSGLSKSQAGAFVGGVVELITSIVEKGEPVKIPSLGGWKRWQSAARVGRNPQTGEPIQIPARVKVALGTTKLFSRCHGFRATGGSGSGTPTTLDSPTASSRRAGPKLPLDSIRGNDGRSPAAAGGGKSPLVHRNCSQEGFAYTDLAQRLLSIRVGVDDVMKQRKRIT
jgi:DNA-binding protein HU-beta